MITLTVISFNGAPADSALSASFDELGGTIGRADSNQLVLPDPGREISRVHAQVVFRGGAYAIVDRGSNPILVNNQPAGSGRELPIREGDQVQIGGYLLSVRQSAPKKSAIDDPFADLLAPAPPPAAVPARAAAAGAASVDPLAAFGMAPAPAPANDPFASFGRASAPPAASHAGGIPDDWDPLAPDPSPAPDLARSLGQKPAAGQFGLDLGGGAPAPLIPGLPASGGDSSLDSLFGLKPGSGADPLANSLLDAPIAQPNMAAHGDPLQSLKSAPKASATAAPDLMSDLQRPFTAPPMAAPPMPAAPTPATPIPPIAAPAASRTPGAVMSWDDPGSDGHTIIRPSAAPTAAPVPPAAARPAAPSPAMPPVMPPDAMVRVVSPVPAPPPVAPPPSAAPWPAAAVPPAQADALLAAFREGLSAPHVTLPALTPEVMRLIGQLLHESAKGTVELLVARAALKREIRATATMIVARENNPLKFSPSVEAALGHLLAPPTPGFMAAAPAMRDAYDDLRAHQFGFIAGMRAALEGVLERFDPAVLEGRIVQKGLQSLLPASRKARMWETFVELYGQIRRDAEDDFHNLFGKAFLRAYEEHIDQLKRDPSP